MLGISLLMTQWMVFVAVVAYQIPVTDHVFLIEALEGKYPINETQPPPEEPPVG